MRILHSARKVDDFGISLDKIWSASRTTEAQTGNSLHCTAENSLPLQSYIYQVLQTIQMKLILLCVWAEPAVLGSATNAVKFIYKI